MHFLAPGWAACRRDGLKGHCFLALQIQVVDFTASPFPPVSLLVSVAPPSGLCAGGSGLGLHQPCSEQLTGFPGPAEGLVQGTVLTGPSLWCHPDAHLLYVLFRSGSISLPAIPDCSVSHATANLSGKIQNLTPPHHFHRFPLPLLAGCSFSRDCGRSPGVSVLSSSSLWSALNTTARGLAHSTSDHFPLRSKDSWLPCFLGESGSV